MQRISYLLIATIALLFSCRKGEDDPFLSLRTRDARIRGEWILKEKTYSESFGLEESFDGTTYTIKQNGVIAFQYPYQYRLTIEKGGTTKIFSSANYIETNSKDYWSWANTNKKKTVLILGNGTYIVKRLTNKELVLERNLTEEDNGSTNQAYLLNMKFEKK